MGGINKFLGIINGEADCGKGKGGEREGNENSVTRYMGVGIGLGTR